MFDSSYLVLYSEGKAYLLNLNSPHDVIVGKLLKWFSNVNYSSLKTVEVET